MESLPDSVDVAAVERAHCAYLAWRGRLIGAEPRTLPGRGVAVLSTTYPDHWYANRIICAEPGDARFAASIADGVRASGGGVRVEIAEPWLDDAAADALVAAGLAPAWDARIVGARIPADVGEASGPASVGRVGRDSGQRFWDAYEAAFGEQQPERAAHGRALAGSRATIWAYTAEQAEVTIGVALMFVHERTAVLADAATLPEWRRRGVHRQLVAARLADAREAGARVVTSDVEPGGGSHRNLVRLGLEHDYRRSVWTAPDGR
ncbi:MAG TPA: GNAT family N-acetyltransferase [Gaiellales bacterium]|nr:GNAT family N-acetyltransferase [Gaiellales bacterium]